jgi:diguanylate cyclase (GGDEF)-like protein/PAS domain S-box-containing protein
MYPLRLKLFLSIIYKNSPKRRKAMTTMMTANDITPITSTKAFYKVIIRRFICIYTIMAAILAFLIFYIYQGYTHNLEQKILSREETFVASTTQAIQKEIQVQLRIMQVNAKLKLLRDFIDNGNKVAKQELQLHFSNLALTFYHYDQIRFIDLQGHERIRVNYKNNSAVIVSDQNLQDKSRTKYFREGIKLAPGQIYVTPMELNIEHNQIEYPYKPVVRFTTPVVNSKGEKMGLFVLNYLATELLESFREQMELRLRGQGMLINPQGYWISNHDRSNEWGNSLDQVDQKFEHQYPKTWQTIKNNEDGVLKTSQGIFRYKSINPFNTDGIGSYRAEDIINLSISNESKENSNWKLVIFLPNEEIQKESFFYSTEGRIIIFFFFVALGTILLLLLILYERKYRQDAYDLFIKEELNDLYENSPCGYHSLDKQGKIIKINQTELNWLGYTREEVLGKSFTYFLTPSSLNAFQSFLENLKVEKQISGIVLEILCKDGSTFFVSTSATSILEKGLFAIARTSTFDISDRIKLENRLAYIANTDVLTNISNRRHFFTLAKGKFNTEGNVSLLMLDIDHFKKVNDQYGHDIGDEVLKHIVLTLKQALPKDAIFARLGGEEFAVLLSAYNSDNTLSLAQKLCKLIENTPVIINTETTLNITVSIGTANRTKMSEDINFLLKQGDINLYHAKTTGRNKAI